MNKKEEKILSEIVKYVKENYTMPTRRYLQEKLGFKSVNSITQYIKSLEEKNYLIRNSKNKLILDNSAIFYKKQLKTIRIINKSNAYIKIILDKNSDYVAYEINNNFFKNINILKKDILIIQNKKNLKPGDIGLFIIENKYRIMKYNYKDGFYILRDKEELILSKIETIGKVIMIERKL